MLNCFCQKINRAAFIVALLAGWAALSGCQTQSSTPKNPSSGAGQNPGVETPPASPETTAASSQEGGSATNSLVLHEGDVLRISFPGASSLNTVQTIRRDGKITMEMVGEVKAAGMTSSNLEQEILKAYGDQLADKEVSVVVQSSTFVVFVTGAVLKPGKIVSDREESLLDAVVEAGIIHDKANLKKVAVIRKEDNGQIDRFTVDLDQELKHGTATHFVLKSMDTIYVPEKFNWF